MNPALITLQERGFFQQCTDVEGLSKLMDQGPVTFYVGCDPTGPSLHIGHMVPFFAMRHLRKYGHRAIALLGGGTARIGDPSGKTEMRKMLSYEQIAENAASMSRQLDAFIGFDGDNAFTANNADWLSKLNYIDFLRDIGRHFSVNRMLSFEAYKKRMETGLTFIEFNYQLLQSFDFLKLQEQHGCKLQIGGDDQWGNIVAGIDLIRRINGTETFGLTFPLVTTADGKKMGKSEKGALFLDAGLCSPYDFYQYWRNIQDADVERFLLMFTFLPTEECRALGSARDAAINASKERLAWEVTALIHGDDEANKARDAARAAFGGEGSLQDVPSTGFAAEAISAGLNILDVLVASGIAASKGEARRLIQQGGVSIEGEKIESLDYMVPAQLFDRDSGTQGVLLKCGKKRFQRLVRI